MPHRAPPADSLGSSAHIAPAGEPRRAAAAPLPPAPLPPAPLPLEPPAWRPPPQTLRQPWLERSLRQLEGCRPRERPAGVIPAKGGKGGMGASGWPRGDWEATPCILSASERPCPVDPVPTTEKGKPARLWPWALVLGPWPLGPGPWALALGWETGLDEPADRENNSYALPMGPARRGNGGDQSHPRFL